MEGDVVKASDFAAATEPMSEQRDDIAREHVAVEKAQAAAASEAGGAAAQAAEAEVSEAGGAAAQGAEPKSSEAGGAASAAPAAVEERPPVWRLPPMSFYEFKVTDMKTGEVISLAEQHPMGYFEPSQSSGDADNWRRVEYEKPPALAPASQEDAALMPPPEPRAPALPDAAEEDQAPAPESVASLPEAPVVPPIPEPEPSTDAAAAAPSTEAAAAPSSDAAAAPPADAATAKKRPRKSPSKLGDEPDPVKKRKRKPAGGQGESPPKKKPARRKPAAARTEPRRGFVFKDVLWDPKDFQYTTTRSDGGRKAA